MGMNINVRLGGSGGNSRQAKLSGLQTSKTTKKFKYPKNLSPIAKENLNPVLMSSGIIMASAKGAERLINFGADIYGARSGEDMIVSNIKAYSKTGATFGLNLVAGAISNYLFTEPRIERQNNMKEYGRELYFQNGYTRKNELT